MRRGQQDPNLARNAKVIAAVDLPGVPAGTRGKVKVVNGFRWIRYWVRFANGLDIGQISEDQLVSPEAWEASARAQAKRERSALAEQRRLEYLAASGQKTA